jgi:plasmid stabilization system protein ParE
MLSFLAGTIYDFYFYKITKKSAKTFKNGILSSISQLINYPESGSLEEILNNDNFIYRYIISHNCKIIYRINNKEIIIVDIFDSRQNPNKIFESIR